MMHSHKLLSSEVILGDLWGFRWLHLEIPRRNDVVPRNREVMIRVVGTVGDWEKPVNLNVSINCGYIVAK